MLLVLIHKAGPLAVAVTVVVIGFRIKIASIMPMTARGRRLCVRRSNRSTLIIATGGMSAGFSAIQRLRHDCGAWWQGTFLKPVMAEFFRDCIDLKSVNFGEDGSTRIQVPAANLSYSNLACTNVTAADLRRARLRGASFRGADLTGADLRGADLSEEVDMTLANVSWARLDRRTVISPSRCTCSCIIVEPQGDGTLYRHLDPDQGLSDEMKAMIARIKPCPAERNRCEPYVIADWKCARNEMASPERIRLTELA